MVALDFEVMLLAPKVALDLILMVTFVILLVEVTLALLPEIMVTQGYASCP